MRKTLVLLISLSCMADAADLVSHPWPMSGDFYVPLEAAAVRYDGLRTFPEWRQLLTDKNPLISMTLAAPPVIGLDIQLDEDEDPQESLQPFIDEAKVRAAKAGANLLFMDNSVKGPSGFIAARFTAYRVEYRQRLVSPLYLAALPETPVSASDLFDELARWNQRYQGFYPMTFNADTDRIKRVLSYVRHLPDHAKLRVVLKDGTELRGDFRGLDADDKLWIHPTVGLLRFLSDRSVQPQDVQFLALLN